MKSLKGLTVTVTKLDIQRGVRGDACKCAVARAVRRAAKLPKVVFVGIAGELTIISESGRVNAIYCLPKPAHRFINNVDSGNPVRPLKFKIGREVKA